MSVQVSYLPVTADDQNRQQQVFRAFQLVEDFFKGVDSVQRMEPGNVNSSGVLGPQQSGVDIGVGQGGEVYIRGSSQQVAASQQPPKPAATGLAGMMTGNPWLWVLAAGAAVWFLRGK